MAQLNRLENVLLNTGLVLHMQTPKEKLEIILLISIRDDMVLI